MNYERLKVSESGDATVARLVDRKIRDEATIRELGGELMQLADESAAARIVLNFADVEFLSSIALSHLIALQKKLAKRGGALRLCNVRPELYDIFRITQLNKLFEIEDDQIDAMATL